ncbi:hypothetical protein D3C75_1228620 [compost metagenome]
MANGHVADQRSDSILVEYFLDQPHAAVIVEVASICHADARALFPPVLQGMQAVI